MSPLTWEGGATVQHLNVRKQGPDDEKELALDVKLVAETSADVLAYFGDALSAFLFQPDGSLRFPMMEPVSWSGEIRHMLMTMSGHEFRDVTLKKFAFGASEGRKVSMTFSASFMPRSREAALIAEMLAECVIVSVQPEGDLLSDVDKETGEVKRWEARASATGVSDVRLCCGTLPGSQHRSTCARSNTPNAEPPRT